VATGKDLPELCREQLPRAVSRGLWAQAELVAMATDMAEFIGAAIGLNLLFRTPLVALTRRADIMGPLANRPLTTCAAVGTTAIIIALNSYQPAGRS
jgi:Mn2+/Fe2+ NRAMP family transporter